MGVRVPSLEEEARRIFGAEDARSIQRWVSYWRESRQRNELLLENFRRLILLDFRDKRLLDIGCGTGGLGEVVEEECRLYVGGDYESHVLQFAHPAGRRCYVQCNAPSLPFRPGSFDYIFAFDVIEHLSGGRPWQTRFLQELCRVLRPLGMIFLTTPNRWYPYEGHSQLYFPQYLPSRWSDRYIRRMNPGFLREHHSFSEIRILTPAQLREYIEQSGLVFLHELPCGLDRDEFFHHFPVRGLLARTGLGWYPHAEFWGILVHRADQSALRLKLKKNWFYEKNQPSSTHQPDFLSGIHFHAGSFNHQLGPGWHWYEEPQPRGRGYRWTQKEASCYLESRSRARYVQITGFSPWDNHLEVFVDGIRVGERALRAQGHVEVKYLIPFRQTLDRIFEVRTRCRRTFRADDPRDQRELGLMVFSVELLDV